MRHVSQSLPAPAHRRENLRAGSGAEPGRGSAAQRARGDRAEHASHRSSNETTQVNLVLTLVYTQNKLFFQRREPSRSGDILKQKYAKFETSKVRGLAGLPSYLFLTFVRELEVNYNVEESRVITLPESHVITMFHL